MRSQYFTVDWSHWKQGKHFHLICDSKIYYEGQDVIMRVIAIGEKNLGIQAYSSSACIGDCASCSH